MYFIMANDDLGNKFKKEINIKNNKMEIL